MNLSTPKQKIFTRRQHVDNMYFEESKHPRDKKGRFSDKGESDYSSEINERIRWAKDSGIELPLNADGSLDDLRLQKLYAESKREMTPAEKIASVHIKAGENNVLPELNEKNLSEIGVHTNKPVLIKSQIYERNIMKHDDVDPKEIDYIIGHALYDENNRVVRGKNKSGNYYIFYTKTSLFQKAVNRYTELLRWI